ncbi:MAG: hypothetical protein RQ867_09650 [Mariprofundaceae bacterium]|nr:hypothetical protein [Mariprofundaceae bacterium]
MKHLTLAFTLALGLVAPGLATAADSVDNGNAIYERDLALWSGTGLNSFKAPQPASKMVCLIAKKAHFTYDSIYADDLAVSAGADQGIEGPVRLALNEPRLASNKVCLPSRNTGLTSQKPNFAYDAYDAIKARDLAIAS